MIRVTPNAASAQRIKDELHLIRYLISKDLKHICAPIPVSARAGSADLKDDDFVVLEGPLVIVAFEFASGEPVNFGDWLWISDEKFARSWGHWSGLLHNMTVNHIIFSLEFVFIDFDLIDFIVLVQRQYAVDHPDRAANFRNWDQLHDSILANAPLDPADAASASDPSKFGVLHGDLNISNFFWRANGAEQTYGEMWVFDWDQAQRGWFLWDLSSVLFFPYMLSRAGTWMDGSAVPGIEAYDKFTDFVVQGYEDAAQTKIDLPALHRSTFFKFLLFTLNVIHVFLPSQWFNFAWCSMIASVIARSTSSIKIPPMVSCMPACVTSCSGALISATNRKHWPPRSECSKRCILKK
jgi:Ser/Thr protein kinase RdoA (MazF antagonist)